MKYRSTHGKVAGLSFYDAAFTPIYAVDVGFVLPETIPVFAESDLLKMSNMSYLQLVEAIAAVYIDDSEIPRHILRNLIRQAYTRLDNSGEENPPIRRLYESLTVLELNHGPNLCFKDFAMFFTVQLMNYFLEQSNIKATALVATSGDTGGSAAIACAGLEHLSLIVLLPGAGRCSKAQRLSMVTVDAPNVRVLEVDVDSDSLDIVLQKLALECPDITGNYLLCSLNSSNWLRIMFQIAAYFFAYFQAVKGTSSQHTRQCHIVVPSGGGGNITAGCLASKMGLPIYLTAATNSNGGLYRFFHDGQFVPQTVKVTPSRAMDINIPYNIPRILTLLVSNDRDILTKFDKMEKFQLNPDQLDQLRSVVKNAFCISDADCLQTVRDARLKFGYSVCPHTACALSAANHILLDDKNSNIAVVVIATAHPDKFADVFVNHGMSDVTSAAGRDYLSKMETKIDKSIQIPSDDKLLPTIKKIIIDFNS